MAYVPYILPFKILFKIPYRCPPGIRLCILSGAVSRAGPPELQDRPPCHL